MTKVLLLDPRASTPDYCASLIKSLRREGVDAYLLTSDFYPDPFEPADSIVGREYFFLRFSRKLRRSSVRSRWKTRLAIWLQLPEYLGDCGRLFFRVVRERPIVHVQWLMLPVLDLLVLRMFRLLRVPILITAHNPIPHDSKATNVRLFIYQRIYNTADLIIVHNNANRRELQQMFNVNAVATVPIGLMFADAVPLARSEARGLLGWEQDEVVLLFHGQIRRYKGLDILLKAMAEAVVSRRVRVVIAANWRFVGPDERRELEALLAAARLMHRVDVHDEVAPLERLTALACGADVLVLPYRRASASLPAMMAFRFGLPMIASDADAFVELMHPELSEWVFRNEDASDLARRIEQFCDLSHTEVEELRAVISSKGERQYSWKSIAVTMRDIYSELSKQPHD